MKRISQYEKTKPEILVQGEFTPEQIKITSSPSNRVIDPKLEEQIEPLWTRIKRVAEVRGQQCYNGTVYRLNDLRTEKAEPAERERERERERFAAKFAPEFAAR